MNPKMTVIMALYNVYQKFRLNLGERSKMNIFGVTFEHFSSEFNALRQPGQYQKFKSWLEPKIKQPNQVKPCRNA